MALFRVSALRVLFGFWALGSAAFIEFYARRYEYAGIPLVPQGALAIAALAILLLPPALAARLPARREVTRLFAVGVVCAAGLVVAARHSLQLLHVSLVCALLAAALGSVVVLLGRRAPAGGARIAAALALASLTFLLLLYYGVLVIGLEMWNQVVSRELIWTYARQLPELVAALPVKTWIPWTASAGVLLGLTLAYWLALPSLALGVRSAFARSRAYFAAEGPGRRSRLAALAAGVASAALLSTLVFETAAHGRTPDPILTTFFAEPGKRGTINMPHFADPALDAQAREAAAQYEAPERIARKTLVLITVDALRADQMNVYGHARENTPFLSRLYREGRLTRFENAFAACTESYCGLLAILGGRNWHEIGVGREQFSLADVLKRLGYRNHFLLGGDHANFYDLRKYYGASVDEYTDGASASSYMNDDAEVIEWLEALDASGDAPRFVYVHLMSVHVLGKRHPRFRVWYRTAAGRGDDDEACCPPHHEYANNYHDGILQTDALIERIFGILEAKGLMQDVMVVITADHGEHLGEDGRLGHGGGPEDVVMRVPLLVYDSGGFEYPRHELASVIDVAPTMLARIGAPVPKHWTGVTLTRRAPGRLVLMQGYNAFAMVGSFDGELFKHYRAVRGNAPVALVRLDAPGVERPVLPERHPQVLQALRARLQQRVPALERVL